MADKKARAAGIKKAAQKKMAQIALTPKDMSQADIEQKAMGMGLLDPLAEQQPQGGVPQAPANILVQTPAGQGAPPQAPVAAPAAPAPAVGGQLGPGVQMSPQVQIRPTPPQAVLAPPMPSGSDMPNPHAPEPQDEEPDMDEDDAYGAMPWRMG